MARGRSTGCTNRFNRPARCVRRPIHRPCRVSRRDVDRWAREALGPEQTAAYVERERGVGRPPNRGELRLGTMAAIGRRLAEFHRHAARGPEIDARLGGYSSIIVRQHLSRFLEHVEEGSHAPLPGFVRDELRGFAVCGDFSQGFVRTACRRCGDELRVPFPCKGRGFCPSCMGRRMAEGAALLVDHVLPPVGYRPRPSSSR